MPYHIKNTIPSRCSQTPIMHVIATLIRIHSHILPLVSSYIHPSCFSVNCFVSSGIIFSSRPVLPTSSIHFQTTSLRIVLVNLICHDHHPQQKHTSHQLESPLSLPTLTCTKVSHNQLAQPPRKILTNTMLLQISQRIDIRSRIRPPIDIDITIPIHATRSPKLYRYDYQTDHP